MRPIIIDIIPDDVDPNGVFEDQTLGGAGDFILNGSGVVDGEWISPDGFAKKIGFESAGNISGVNFTVNGFADADRHVAISETLAGPNANTVQTTNYFYVITSISADAAVGTNTEAGPVDELTSPVIPLNWRGGITSVNIDITGTMDITIQNTFDNIQDLNDLIFNWQDSPSTRLVNATASTNDAYEGVPRALRAVINSYSSGATAQLVIQARDI